MIYTEPLPRTKKIKQLAKVVGPFPAGRWEISETAHRQGFDKNTLHFLELFPEDEVFETREDFSTRSEELIMLIREEAKMDEEGPLSPLD